MQYEKYFKNIILLYFVIFILDIAFAYFAEGLFAPSPDYVFISEDKPFFLDIIPSSIDTILLIIMFFVVVVYLISLYFLFTFKKFGKKLFIICYIILLIYLPFTYGYYYSGVEELIALLSYLFEGLIIAFLYFTPIKEKFN